MFLTDDLKGDIPEDARVVQGQAGRAHEDDEQVRGHTQVVVLLAARGDRGHGDGALHRVQERGAAAVVGAPLRLCHRLRLHAPHQHHHCHHKHGTCLASLLLHTYHTIQQQYNSQSYVLRACVCLFADTGAERHHGVLHGADHAGETHSQRVLQGLRLHEHEPVRLLPH